MSSVSPSPAENPFQAPTASPPQSRRWLWLLIGGALAALCLCSGMCLVPIGLGVYTAVNERSSVEQVVTGYLTDLDRGEYAQAANRFSQRAQRVAGINPQQMEKLATENKAFQDGRAAHVSQINVSTAFNTNPDTPQGLVATVSGTIDYDGGGRGTFRATLEKEDGQWRLHLVNVNRQN